MYKSDFISLPIKIGISTCLLGEKVRFDGGHKKDKYLTDILGNYFEFVPSCPEIEIGMGVPRESIRLVGDPNSPLLIGPKSNTDWTDKMVSYSEKRIKVLDKINLCGYIFKSDSPTCGMERVRVYSEAGMPNRSGRGLFTDIFIKSNPLIPVEEEGRLNDAKIRENFITRVFGFSRLQNLLNNNFSRGTLVRFHTIHKYLMLSHSTKHYQLLGKLVAESSKHQLADIGKNYSALFMEGLQIKTTTKKNVNVLQHILGYLKKQLSSAERQDILKIIDDYHQELIPLIVPITLLRHYIYKFSIEYIKDQVYLNPHPKELMLRNHV
jgi:uncharacterized protein YbgA (DUF1722 family)/uncharacterized protein YbbK (DUF523 family)